VIIQRGISIMGPTVIGAGCLIGKNCRITESILLNGTIASSEARINRSVTGRRSRITEGTRIDGAVIRGDHLSRGELQAGDKPFNFKEVFFLNLQSRYRRLVRKLYLSFKEASDRFLALLGLMILSPLMLFVAVLIKLGSPGPVIYRQKRCGRGGREFTMLKFRTMSKDADKRKAELTGRNESDGPMFKITHDPRVVFPGHFLRQSGMDELPQLINVLRGEMSLIGPRPLAAEEMRYCVRWQNLRLSVKPGITGLWQVKSRETSSFHPWIEDDIQYITHQSFRLDMKIFFLTLFKMGQLSGV